MANGGEASASRDVGVRPALRRYLDHQELARPNTVLIEELEVGREGGVPYPMWAIPYRFASLSLLVSFTSCGQKSLSTVQAT